MATYLQGVTDTGFNPISYSPNLPFLMNALQKVTARYEKNYNDMSEGYSSILNADIINDVKNKERNGYLDKIKDNLKTISTTDLSVQSNIDAANSLYTPFWEDKSMLSHIADSKARKNQLAEQERIKKEHPDYDNYTPTTVMNYYMNKIKTAENPDIINEVPLINAVGLRNNPKEFQEWLEKNKWKQEASVAQNGRVYKQINGDNSLVPYSELYKMYLGNSAQDQYNMYGEYFKIQAIQDIKYKKKENEKIDISDEEAVQLIPTYYVDQQLKNYGLQKKSLMTEMFAVEENAKNYTDDPLKHGAATDRIVSIGNTLKEIIKKENLLKNKGGDNEDDKKDYDDLITSIKTNPVDFFAKIKYNTDTESAAKMAASNQSLTITADEGAIAAAKLQQDADQFAKTFDLKIAELQATIDKNNKNVSKTTVRTVDSEGNVISEEEESTTGKTSFDNSNPIVSNAPSSNSLVDVVTGFENVLKNYNDRGMGAIINVLQSSKSDILSKIILPQEISTIAKAYQNGEIDKDYHTILKRVTNSLSLNGVSKEKTNNINGPVGLLLALADYYNSEIEKDFKIKKNNIKNNVYDEKLDKRIYNHYNDYTAIQTARSQVNNAWAYKQDFDKNINTKIQNNPEYYKKVSIKKPDGTFGIVTPQSLIDNYPLEATDSNGKKIKASFSYRQMQEYINGTLDWKFDAKKTEANYEAKYEKELDNQGFFTELFFGKKIKKDDSKTNYNSYYALDPNTGVKYDITKLVEDYGLPKELNKNLNKLITNDISLLPIALQKSIRSRTGEMGRTITYISSTKTEKDRADKYAINFAQNINANVIRTDDKYNILHSSNDDDLIEKLNSDVVNQIISTPTKGLNAISFDPIGKRDPGKRNVTLKYDKAMLLGKDAKDYGNWDGLITFEIEPDAIIEGFPSAEAGAYYDLLLNSNSKGIKQTDVDEEIGLKFAFYKDQDNQIRYNVGFQKVVVDKETKKLSYVWVDARDGSEYNENGGFTILPNNVTIEDVLDNLRNSMLEQYQINSTLEQKNSENQKKTPSISTQTIIDEQQKRINNVTSQFR
jgi:hypothetical protein